MKQHTCEPANGIIDRFGGAKAVAEALEKDESTIRRWRMPRPNGTGGFIPDEDKIRLIKAARRQGIALSWRDFEPPQLRKSA